MNRSPASLTAGVPSRIRVQLLVSRVPVDMGGSAQALWMLDSPVSGATFQDIAFHEPELTVRLCHTGQWYMWVSLTEITQDVVLEAELDHNRPCRVSDPFLLLFSVGF